jgi:mRNA interferase ChpB
LAHPVIRPAPADCHTCKTGRDELTRRPVVLPITPGGDVARRLGVAVPISGIGTRGIVPCDQPRARDRNALKARKVDTLPAAVLDDGLARAATLSE